MRRDETARWPELLERLDRGAEGPLMVRGSWQRRGSSRPPSGSREADSSRFVCWQADGRWLLQQPAGVLRVIGDSTRDLMAEEGGLVRVPAPCGWGGELVSYLLRPDVRLMDRDEVRGHALKSGPELDEVASRRCWVVTLRTPDKGMDYRLWVDEVTGLRLRCDVPEHFSVTLDELAFAAPDDAAQRMLGLLDVVPDVDHTPVPDVPEGATPYLAAVQAAIGGGCRVSVLTFSDFGDDEWLTFRVDSDELGMAVVDRRLAEHAPPYRSTLGDVDCLEF